MRILAGVLLLATVAARGEVFKWTDPSGRVHYGDKPPAQVEPKQLDRESIPFSVTEPTAKPGLRPGETELLRKIERDERRAEQERAAEARRLERESRRQAKEEQKRRSKCAYYKSRHDAVMDRLGTGYTAKQANSLHSRADDYAAKISEYCR